eukprot:Plantae.Rhodophyta-Purpureofilum_apyrenoidigerum.ctg10130.p1 GENE.Plantae.Rhodophyta-Purpureofilum_apyrenoidigerum.ctg10130~~Plantae.Rhodophyta-Purpureofilum_apyrenoidigerum.ctg10130.p1  ORF type:complete len:583 (+),score=69.21 Plantae.Rhodophyta-Purpureofilum_apyrenoidigerum.ctg10130:126-1751(+)
MGFSALGYAKMTRQATVAITSSGTAVANLLPAVVEASMSKIPLIVLTADRPPELRDCGAPQSIDQVKIFGAFVRYFHDVQCPTDTVSMRNLLSLVDHAVWHATSIHDPGPVHLNLMFRENLAPDQQPWDCAVPLRNLQDWSRDLERRPLIRIVEPAAYALAESVPRLVLDLLRSCQKCLIVAGDGLSPEDQSAIKSLALRLQCPVVPDILSGLRFGKVAYVRISYIDIMLGSSCLEASHFSSEFAVLQFGERIVSKKLNALLAKPNVRRIIISPYSDRLDESHSCCVRIVASALTFVLSILEAKQLPTLRCFAELGPIDLAIHRHLQEIVEAKANKSLTEPYIAMTVSKYMVPRSDLFLSNSMPIRDFNVYGNHDNSIRTVSNRGANGIDGILSTAIGCALGSSRPLVLVVGDIAFLHDLSAMHSLREIVRRWPRLNMKILIVNNYGGGIFSFLPIAKYDILSEFFTTPHSANFRHLCHNFDIPYVHIASELELHNLCQQKLGQPGVMIIEATCLNADENVNIHRQLNASLVSIIDRLVGS